jgi:thiamine biosynthesis lipoprotein
MGTFFTFSIADDVENSRISNDVARSCTILVDADERFSLYKPASETSRLNSKDLSWEKASPVQVEVQSLVLDWRDKTSGFFDPVSPNGTYDPSGLVKTWAAKNAAMFLEANGYGDFTLNAGGDVYVGPRVQTNLLNRVGLSNLKSVADKDASVNMIIDLTGSPYRAVATSGSSERGEHIWSKGDSVDSTFLQATVVAEDLVTADIWATALISGGKQALDLFEHVFHSRQAVAIVTNKDGRITSTRGFAQVLANLQ